MPSLNFSLFNKKANRINRDLKLEQIKSLVMPNEKISIYLKKYLNNFKMVAFRKIKNSINNEILFNLNVPIRSEDDDAFKSGTLEPQVIFENMAFYIGIIPNDVYSKRYIDVLNSVYGNKASEVLFKKGKNSAREGKFFEAIILLRAVLSLKPDYLDAIYIYGRAAREISRYGGDLYSENNKGNFFAKNTKKENMIEVKDHKTNVMIDFEEDAFRIFKALVICFPNYPEGHYFLGYMYINKSNYINAVSTFKKYLKVSRNLKDRREIKRRIKQLTPTAKIEEGCKLISRGKYSEGISILEGQLDSKYKDWPHLYFYLGLGYKGIKDKKKAVEYFKKTLELKPEYTDAKVELNSLK